MHRFLAIGLAASLGLAWSGEAAAWSWPADGAVLRAFTLGADAYAAGQHRGIDVAGADGSAVVAPASGVVTFAGSLPTYGRGLTILTDDGYAVTLVHLGRIDVAKGDAVSEGAAVGTIGSSGTPEQDVPSVHLGIRRAADEEGYVDPLSLLPPRPAPAPAPAPTPASAVASASAPQPAAAPVPVAQATPIQQPSPPAPEAPASPDGDGSPAPVATSTASGVPRPATGDASRTTSPIPPAEAPGASASSPKPGIAIHAVGGATTSPRPTATADRAEAPAQRAMPPAIGPLVVRSAAVAPHSLAPKPVATSGPMNASEGVGVRARSSTLGVERASHTASLGQSVVRPTVLHDATTKADASHPGRDRVPAAARSVPAEPERLSPRVRAADGSRLVDVSTRATPIRAAHEASSAERVLPIADHGRIGLPALAAGLALAALLAVAVGQRAARRIGMDGAVLRHHADLLRQLDAAHRPRVHDRGGGRVRPPSTAART